MTAEGCRLAFISNEVYKPANSHRKTQPGCYNKSNYGTVFTAYLLQLSSKNKQLHLHQQYDNCD